MATAKQIEANRRNAKKSTGPRSDLGKAKVSQNRFKHGLCGNFRVLGNEEQADYDDLLERFLETEKPVDDVEHELVAKMARHTWLSERAIRCQDGCFILQPQTPEQKAADKHGIAVRTDLDMYMRYMTTHDRAYQRAADALAKRRKERLQAEIGFERQKRAEAEEKRRAELQPHKVQAAKARAEREESNATMAAMKAASQMEAFLPPETAQIAA